MPEYTVQSGDCISSISDRFGLFWKTVWEAAENSELKKLRGAPNVLQAGDVVFVPDIRPKTENGATEQRHTFRRKGVPAKLVFQACEDGEPKADRSYRISVDGQLTEGKTDADGRLEISIPPGALRAEVYIDDEDGEIRYKIDLGGLDPADSTTGVQQRLRNLGFYVGPIDGELSEATIGALHEFQQQNDMEETEELSAETCDKLKEVHGT